MDSDDYDDEYVFQLFEGQKLNYFCTKCQLFMSNMIYLIMKNNELLPFLYKMSKKLGVLSTKLKLCAFTSLKDDSNANNDPSDDIIEKELEIKLDITKKSRRINRPVQFADQHGMMFSADIIHPIFRVRSDHGGGADRRRASGPVHRQEPRVQGHPVCRRPVRERGGGHL